MSFAQAMKINANLQEGPKGALEHKTTNDPIIDLYLKLSRTTNNKEVYDLLDKCISDSPEKKKEMLYTVITLLHKRLPRGGEGLRDNPIHGLVHLYGKYPEYRTEMENVMIELNEFGRYNDYWRIMKIIVNEDDESNNYFNKYDPLIRKLTESYLEQVDKDLKNKEKNESVSWAGKYFPRPKGKEDSSIYWYYAIYDDLGNIKKLFKLSLTYYLTHLYYNKSVFNKVKYPVIKEDRLPSTQNLKNMRKIYTSLTEYLKVPEVNMTNQTWGDIDFKYVPSVCRFKNSDAFQNIKKKELNLNDEKGNRYPNNMDRVRCRKNFIEYMTKKEIKNCKNDPVDILKKMIKTSPKDTTNELILEKMWESVVNETEKNVEIYKKDLEAKSKEIYGEDYEMPEIKPVIPMIDISPSMDSSATSQYSCKEVAIALGILASRLNKKPYRNLVMTYSSEPKILLLEHKENKPYTLRESYQEIMKYCGYTTDLMKAFDLVLDISLKNNIEDKDLADLSILSDMGFDQQISPYYSQQSCWNTTQDNIELKFKQHSYTTPQIYYVNLSNDSHIQATIERKGVSQFKSYSSSLFKYIMTGNLVLSTQKVQEDEKSSDNLILKKSTEDDFMGMINQSIFEKIREIFNMPNTITQDGYEVLE